MAMGMKFSGIRRCFYLGILLALPFLQPQPAQAFLTLQDYTYGAASQFFTQPEQRQYSPQLQQAIALLEAEKYAEADAILVLLIQSSPTVMDNRDFYYTSQLLQNNWLNLAKENADRAYLNLPAISFPDPLSGNTPSLNLPQKVYERINALDWSQPPDVAAAIAQVESQVVTSPDTVQPRLTLAVLYLLAARQPQGGETQIEKAYDQLRELVRRRPTDAQARLILAIQLPQSAEKTAAYRESIQVNPQLPYAWMGYATDAMVNQTDFSEVMEIIGQGIQANPEDYRLYYYAGRTLMDKGQYDEAIEYFKQSTRVQPRFTESWSYMFIAFDSSSQDRTNDRLEGFEQMVTLNLPYNPALLNFDVGELNSQMVRANRIPELIAVYNRVSRKEAAIASRGLFQLGFLLDQVAPGRKNQIIRLHRRAYQLDSTRQNLRLLASVLNRHGQPVEGERLLRQFLADEPTETAVYARPELAFAIAQQDLNRAMKYLDEIYAAEGKVSGYEWIGGWLVEQKRWDEAKRFYLKAVQQDPWYNIFLAQIVAEQGQPDEAIAMLRRVMDSLPKENPNHYGLPTVMLADVLAKAGRLEEAIALYQEAANYSKSPNLYYVFAELLKRYQRWDEAIAQYQLAIKTGSEQGDKLMMAQSHHGIGQVLIAQGQATAAKTELEQARSLFWDVLYIDRVAEVDREIEALR
jgi:tetratricopeptide (TPR) repeat protein